LKKLPIYISLLFVLTCAKEDSQAPNTPPTQIVKQYALTASAGEGGSVTGGGTFTSGTQVSLTATPSSGYSFSGWSTGSTANPLTVTLNSNTSITANFQVIINSYTLTVTAGEGGNVSSEGGEYEEGTEITVSAIADGCFNFIQWSDGETSPERVVTVNSNIGITAEFELVTPNEVEFSLVRIRYPCALNVASIKQYNETSKYKVASYGFMNVSNRESHDEWYYPTPSDYKPPGIFTTVPDKYQTGDFNSDGLEDIVIVWSTFPHTIERSSRYNYSILINNGDGSMTYDHDAIIDVRSQNHHHAARTLVADFNGDGLDDIVSAGAGVSDVRPDGSGYNIWQRLPLMYNVGDGKFVDASNNIEGQEDGVSVVRGKDFSHHISVGDVDGDDDVDIYVASALLINDGVGNFSNKMDEIPRSLRPIQDDGEMYIESSVIADFNNDGIDDIFASYGNTAFKNLPEYQSYSATYSLSKDGSPSYIDSDIGFVTDAKYGISNTKFNYAVGYDINLDGYKDVVVGVTRQSPYYVGKGLQVFLNVEDPENNNRKFISGDYLLPDGSELDQVHGEGQLSVVDINNDGTLDIVHSSNPGQDEGYSLSYYLNIGGSLTLYDSSEFAFMSQEQIPGKENWGLNGHLLQKAMPINLDNSGWIDYIGVIISGTGDEGGNESILYTVLAKD